MIWWHVIIIKRLKFDAQILHLVDVFSVENEISETDGKWDDANEDN